MERDTLGFHKCYLTFYVCLKIILKKIQTSQGALPSDKYDKLKTGCRFNFMLLVHMKMPSRRSFDIQENELCFKTAEGPIVGGQN